MERTERVFYLPSDQILFDEARRATETPPIATVDGSQLARAVNKVAPAASRRKKDGPLARGISLRLDSTRGTLEIAACDPYRARICLVQADIIRNNLAKPASWLTEPGTLQEAMRTLEGQVALRQMAGGQLILKGEQGELLVIERLTGVRLNASFLNFESHMPLPLEAILSQENGLTVPREKFHDALNGFGSRREIGIGVGFDETNSLVSVEYCKAHLLSNRKKFCEASLGNNEATFRPFSLATDLLRWAVNGIDGENIILYSGAKNRAIVFQDGDWPQFLQLTSRFRVEKIDE